MDSIKDSSVGPKLAAASADVALAQAVARGEHVARLALAERLFDRVRTTVKYLAPGHPDTDDWAQRALIEILRSTASFRGESRLETWADRIAVRTAMRHLRQDRRRAEVVTLVAEPPAEASEGEDDAVLRYALRQHVATLLQRLAPERRSVIVLRFVHGYSITEIAEITGAPVNTVRDRLRIGKSQLRQHLVKSAARAETSTGRQP